MYRYRIWLYEITTYIRKNSERPILFRGSEHANIRVNAHQQLFRQRRRKPNVSFEFPEHGER